MSEEDKDKGFDYIDHCYKMAGLAAALFYGTRVVSSLDKIEENTRKGPSGQYELSVEEVDDPRDDWRFEMTGMTLDELKALNFVDAEGYVRPAIWSSPKVTDAMAEYLDINYSDEVRESINRINSMINQLEENGVDWLELFQCQRSESGDIMVHQDRLWFYEYALKNRIESIGERNLRL